jgi:hypothetical protein
MPALALAPFACSRLLLRRNTTDCVLWIRALWLATNCQVTFSHRNMPRQTRPSSTRPLYESEPPRPELHASTNNALERRLCPKSFPTIARSRAMAIVDGEVSARLVPTPPGPSSHVSELPPPRTSIEHYRYHWRPQPGVWCLCTVAGVSHPSTWNQRQQQPQQ